MPRTRRPFLVPPRLVCHEPMPPGCRNCEPIRREWALTFLDSLPYGAGSSTAVIEPLQRGMRGSAP